MKIIKPALNFLLQVGALVAIFYAHHVAPPYNREDNFKFLQLFSHVLTGTDQGSYISPGQMFKPYAPYLPPRGKVSFLTDFSESNPQVRRLYWEAQTYLAPRVLERAPGREFAIIFCAHEKSAADILAEYGYVWMVQIEPGHGIAKKV